MILFLIYTKVSFCQAFYSQKAKKIPNLSISTIKTSNEPRRRPIFHYFCQFHIRKLFTRNLICGKIKSHLFFTGEAVENITFIFKENFQRKVPP